MALRVVFMGTPDYGVPSLKALVENGYDVVGVFCQPDKPSGRGKKITFCPVKQSAVEQGMYKTIAALPFPGPSCLPHCKIMA